MRSFLSELCGPPGVILLAVIIGGLGAYWAAVKQADVRKITEKNSNAQTDLLRDLAARGGNQKELEELIRTRSRALTSDATRARDIAEGIITKIPKLTTEFTALEQSKHELAEQRVREFRLNWEPLIRWTLERIDGLVKQFQAKGVKLESSGNDGFQLTTFWLRMQTEVRTVKLTGKTGTEYKLVVGYVPINLAPDQDGPSNAAIIIGGMGEFELLIHPEEAECSQMRLTTKELEKRAISAPKDGVIPKEFCDFIEQGLTNAFERLLLLHAASDGKPEPPDAWRYKPSS
jgi:hypothetical protein